MRTSLDIDDSVLASRPRAGEGGSPVFEAPPDAPPPTFETVDAAREEEQVPTA